MDRAQNPRARAIVIPVGLAVLVALAILISIASTFSGRCGAPLSLNSPRSVPLGCDLVSNGYELASYRCVVPKIAGAEYSIVSAQVISPEGRSLGHWDSPISYGEKGYAVPLDSRGPLDTSTHVADDGDQVFGPGDVFHLDSVHTYRFHGAIFMLAGDCWAGSVALE